VKELSKKDLILYSIMAMPLAFAGIPLYVHAPDFYATEYGVSLLTIGLVLLCLRFVDAVQDPLIGYFSDRYANYRPTIMMVASVVLVSSFALLFNPLLSAHVIWFAVFILLATTSFSVLTINIHALGGLWGDSKRQKTIIVGYREVFGVVGLIMAVMLPSVLQNQMPKTDAFSYVSYVLALLMALAVLLLHRWQKAYRHINEKVSLVSWNFRQVRALSGQFKRFFVIYGVSMLASSIPAVLVLFFIRDRLVLESYTGLFLLAYFASSAVGVVTWGYISTRIGKHKAWGVAMLLAVASFVWAYFLNAGDFWAYFIICFVAGVAFGAELILPASILADHIYQNKQQGNVAMCFGVMTLLAKLSLALAAAFTLPYLEVRGFVAGGDNSADALHALSISYALIPCFIKFISIFLLWSVINEKNRNFTNGSTRHA
jgi:Na+/melibiose symporter-like transporter